MDVNGQIQKTPLGMKELLSDQRFEWRTLDVRRTDDTGDFEEKNKLVLVLSTFDAMRAVSKTKKLLQLNNELNN